MEQLVEYIAKGLVTHPDRVEVARREDDDDPIVLELDVEPGDRGKVIGRRGRTAEAMRCVVRAAAARAGRRAALEIVD